VAILFISMFALDSFEPGLTIWQQIGHFLVHLIPSYIFILFLAIAWKWEKAGGIIFLVLGLLFCVLVFRINYERNHFPFWKSLLIVLNVAVPFLLVGVLFLVSYYQKKKHTVS
jgi:uncharacterized membrane protein HdeD (DUF308 family)